MTELVSLFQLHKSRMTRLEVWKQDHLVQSFCAQIKRTPTLKVSRQFVADLPAASPCSIMLPTHFMLLIHLTLQRSIPSSAAESRRAHPFLGALALMDQASDTSSQTAHQRYDQRCSHLLTWMSPNVNRNLMLITRTFFITCCRGDGNLPSRPLFHVESWEYTSMALPSLPSPGDLAEV